MASEKVLHQALENIVGQVLKTYHSKMDDFIGECLKRSDKKNPDDENHLTNADVIVLILNVTVSAASNIYCSLKHYLNDEEKMDFDFMRAKLINELSSEMEKIKTFNPMSNLLKLSTDQIQKFIENGYVDVELTNGVIKRVTKDDILVDRNDADKYLHEIKKVIEEKESANSPKIIQ